MTQTAETQSADTTSPEWREINITSQDGLTLHGRDYGPRMAGAMPVVCLPGLSRTVRDFHPLAQRLSSGAKARRVLVFDLRGRGQSDPDSNPANYTAQREALDVLDMTAALGVGECVVIGTSRGGLVAMVMAILRAGLLKGLVLNDIGPRIEPQGLLRIAAQLNNARQPADWSDAIALIKQMHQEQFTDLTTSQWSDFAHQIFADQDGQPVRDYDPQIAQSLDPRKIAESGIPELWGLFAALAPIPVAVLQGENSDILSSQTLGKMRRMHPNLTTTKIANRGHAPLLTEPDARAAIDELLSRVERN
ncbi:MAG: alpha/beta fold hydrolase [Alphaproteobacteria bacterium]